MEGYRIPERWCQRPSQQTLEEKSSHIEHKIFSAEVKEFSDDDLTITHFISTERLDRGGDVLRAAGMKIDGRVVVLMAHGMSNLGQEPIAKPLKIWPDTFGGYPGICAKTQFYDGSHLNPPDNTGRRLYEKAKGGFLPNWSVGWLPLKWEDGRDSKGNYFRDVLFWTLLEYSPVGVSMNPDAQTIDEGKSERVWFKICPTVDAIRTEPFQGYCFPRSHQKDVTSSSGKTFVEFIKGMKGIKEQMVSIETKLDRIGNPQGDIRRSSQVIVSFNSKEEEEEYLQEISRQLSKQVTEAMERHQETARRMIRQEIDRAKGRVD
jgi:hypothetical protein